MSLHQIFYFFMAVAGIVSGLILARFPEVATFVIKPYFWILAAVALFDIGCYFRKVPMMSLNHRMLGFGIGLIWLFLIPYLAGTKVYLF